MQKPAKILLWISLGMGLLYAIAAFIAMILANTLNTFGKAEGSAYLALIVIYVVNVGVPFLVKILFAVVIFFGLKGKSENIIMEILAIITFSGIFSLLSGIVNSLASNFIAMTGGSEALVTFSYMNTGMAWVEFLCSISTVLFIVAASFSIAYKKIELADLRRILEEEDI